MNKETQIKTVLYSIVAFLVIAAIFLFIEILKLVERINANYPNITIGAWLLIATWPLLGFSLMFYFDKRHLKLKNSLGHNLNNPKGMEIFIAYAFFTSIIGLLTKQYWWHIVSPLF